MLDHLSYTEEKKKQKNYKCNAANMKSKSLTNLFKKKMPKKENIFQETVVTN